MHTPSEMGVGIRSDKQPQEAIYLPCIGWVLLDAAVVVGIIVHR